MDRERRKKPIDFLEVASDRDRAVEIDIVIPAIEKDSVILPLVLEGLRRQVLNTIGSIYIVSPNRPRMTDLCRELDCIHVDESQLHCKMPGEIHYRPGGLDRAGWLFQQFIKLSGEVGTRPWFMVCDADTVLIRPHLYVHDQRPVLYTYGDPYLAYRKCFRRLFGREMRSLLVFTSHMMIFSRNKLKEFRGEIEARAGCRWDEAIIRALDREEISSFSEYDSYGNWIMEREDCTTIPNYNVQLPASSVDAYEALVSLHGTRCKSLSFHSWIHD